MSRSIIRASCAIEIKSIDVAQRRAQLFPAGEFVARDGRPSGMKGVTAKAWVMNAEIAASLIATADALDTPYGFDYEHQSLNSQINGLPAPAAGWFKRLEWVEGEGLFAVDVEWTANAKAYIEADEYRYISPVFDFDRKTGHVIKLINAALTNTPAIDGMAPAAASFLMTQEDNPMNELMERLCYMLNLPLTTTAEEMAVQLDKLKAMLTSAQAATTVDLIAYIEDLQSKASATPDPSQYVALSVFSGMRDENTALKNELAQYQTTALTAEIDEAIKAGQLTPAMKDWAIDLGKKDRASLSAFISSAPKNPALGGDRQPRQEPTTKNDDPETVAVLRAMGVSIDDVAKYGVKTNG